MGRRPQILLTAPERQEAGSGVDRRDSVSSAHQRLLGVPFLARARAFAVLAVAFSITFALLPTQPAEAAPPLDRGWTACSWAASASSNRIIGIWIDSANPFPGGVNQPNLTGGTSLMSFQNGVVQGSNRWGEAVRPIRPPNPGMNIYATTSSNYQDITARYVDGVREGNTRVIANLPFSDYGYCMDLYRSTHDRGRKGVVRTLDAEVLLQRRGDWFTAPDDQRPEWERRCPGQYNGPTTPEYLCTKTLDFHTIFMHEVGHAIGIAHPHDADGTTSYSVYNGPASRLAKCSYTATGTPVDQATMCTGDGRGRTTPGQENIARSWFRSEGRTLDPWDTSSLQAVHDWAFSGVVVP
jgi:hypothetical protein